MKKVVMMIDGGHLRAEARKAGLRYQPAFIQAFSASCLRGEEELLKILYYDCPPFYGKVKLPVSGDQKCYKQSGKWLEELSKLDFFAVREGKLKFRGWVRKGSPPKQALQALSDSDFKPQFEQKGVDIRIGLDIATVSQNNYTDRIILITADTDLLPAMKHARVRGIQVIWVRLPGFKGDYMLPHVDITRNVTWPT